MKILIVDDEKPARDRLSRMVGELAQHQVVGEAVNGVEALGLSQSLEPDIVLMDIRMAEVSGIEALDQIISLRPDVPIVMMTAYFSDEIADQTKNRGAFDCLGKPFDFDELKQTIERAIFSWRPRHSAVL